MTDKKKQPKKTDVAVLLKTELGDLSVSPSAQDNDLGTESEPWKEWKVRPVLVHMLANPPESNIGRRIAYCRGQLDNLSVEALARYTKNFDVDGISRMSIIRYESGDNSPGARELRILCDALWVPANWLLFGNLESQEQAEIDGFFDKWIQKKLDKLGVLILPPGMENILADMQLIEINKRKRWIHEARKPKPR